MVVPLRKDRADWNKFRRNSPDSENPGCLTSLDNHRKGQVSPRTKSDVFLLGHLARGYLHEIYPHDFHRSSGLPIVYKQFCDSDLDQEVPYIEESRGG